MSSLKVSFQFTGNSLMLPALLSWPLVASSVESLPIPPAVIAQSHSNAIVDRSRVRCAITIIENGNSNSNRRLVVEHAEISVRGNSSFHYEKKGYRLEFQNPSGLDEKVELLGLRSNSDWVLYASVTDRTFVRSLLAHELWRSMGRYAVKWRFAELFVLTNFAAQQGSPEQFREQLASARNLWSKTNAAVELHLASRQLGEEAANLAQSYQGLYVALEKIKRGKHRVNIAQLRRGHQSEPEITGGYIFKKDDRGRGEKGLLTGQEFKLRFEEPKERELATVQRQWVTKYLDDFEKALYSRDFRDPVKGYSAYIDVDSFIDFHWLVELAKNADGYWFSQYMHKDRGGKLTMGPIWDWDRTFGNPYFPEQSTMGWRFHSASDPDYTWYRRLFEDPDFLQRYVDRWSELRTNVFSTSNILAQVDRIAGEASPGFQRNAHRWEAERKDVSLRAQAGISHAAEVEDLKRWIRGRLEWIDSQEFPKPRLTNSPEGNTPVQRLSMTCVIGRIFYTTNGSDPRLRGGSPSPRAFEYNQPILITNRVVVTARVKSDFGLWSAPAIFQRK